MSRAFAIPNHVRSVLHATGLNVDYLTHQQAAAILEFLRQVYAGGSTQDKEQQARQVYESGATEAKSGLCCDLCDVLSQQLAASSALATLINGQCQQPEEGPWSPSPEQESP